MSDSAPQQAHVLDYPSELAPPPQNNNVETVRQIVTSALGDGMEIVVLMTLLQRGNENGISANLSNAGAAQAGIMVRNSLFTRLILMLTRKFAKSPSE